MTDLSTEAPVGVLARLGVSSDAEAIWRSLLAQPGIQPNDLRLGHGVSWADLDRAFEELLEVSMVRRGKTPTGLVTIDPALALESRLAVAERQMAEQAEAFTALRMLIPQLARDYHRNRATTNDSPGFEVVDSLPDVQRQIDLAADRTRLEIRSVDHRPCWGNNERAQDEVLSRGVHDRAIFPTSSLAEPDLLADLLSMQERGHDARAHPNVTTRVFIYDRDLAVVPVNPDDSTDGAIFIRVRTLIDVLIMMYDEMWKVAVPIFSSSVDGGAPAGRHARILELLALGNKDEAIGRALNIGVRTIRRDVAELKDTLGVSSRAEIVAAAVRKGWL